MAKILIIEDESAIRRVLTKILVEESKEYEVEEAVEVEEEVGVTQVQRAAQPARMTRNRLQAGLIWSEIWQTPVACRRGMHR